MTPKDIDVKPRTCPTLLRVGIILACLMVGRSAFADQAAGLCSQLFSVRAAEGTSVTFETDREAGRVRRVEAKDQWTLAAVKKGVDLFREAGFRVPNAVVAIRSFVFSATGDVERSEMRVSYVDFPNPIGERHFMGAAVHEVGHLIWNLNIGLFAPRYSAHMSLLREKEMAEHPGIMTSERAFLHALSLPYNELVADVTILLSDTSLRLSSVSKTVGGAKSIERFRDFDSRSPLPWEPQESGLYARSDNFPDRGPYERLAEVRRFIYRSDLRDRKQLLTALFRAIGSELDSLIELPPNSLSDRQLNRRLIEKIRTELLEPV